MVGELASPYQERRKDRKFSDSHTAGIDECSGFRQGVILRGAASARLEWFVNSKNEDFTPAAR